MASFVLSTTTIFSMLVLFLSLVPGLSSRPGMINVIGKTLNNGWSIVNILEYSGKELLENTIQQLTGEVQTNVIMENNLPLGTLNYNQNKSWFNGYVVDKYPTKIEPKGNVIFSHVGASTSTGAVIYLGPNIQGAGDKCAFVVAWNTTSSSGSKNKIYVETGIKSKYPEDNNAPLWSSIYTNLEKAEQTYTYTNNMADECAFMSATATITTYGNPSIANAKFFLKSSG